MIKRLLLILACTVSIARAEKALPLSDQGKVLLLSYPSIKALAKEEPQVGAKEEASEPLPGIDAEIEWASHRVIQASYAWHIRQALASTQTAMAMPIYELVELGGLKSLDQFKGLKDHPSEGLRQALVELYKRYGSKAEGDALFLYYLQHPLPATASPYEWNLENLQKEIEDGRLEWMPYFIERAVAASPQRPGHIYFLEKITGLKFAEPATWLTWWNALQRGEKVSDAYQLTEAQKKIRAHLETLPGYPELAKAKDFEKRFYGRGVTGELSGLAHRSPNVGVPLLKAALNCGDSEIAVNAFRSLRDLNIPLCPAEMPEALLIDAVVIHPRQPKGLQPLWDLYAGPFPENHVGGVWYLNELQAFWDPAIPAIASKMAYQEHNSSVRYILLEILADWRMDKEMDHILAVEPFKNHFPKPDKQAFLKRAHTRPRCP